MRSSLFSSMILTCAVSSLYYIQANTASVSASENVTKPANIEAPKVVEVESDFDCLAKNIYYEAAFEPIKGKQAIAQVTINRLNTGRWGNTICDVVYSPSQFSWTLNKNIHKPAGKEWIESQQVAYSFLENGQRLKSIKGSIMYHADYIKTPVWASKKYRVAKIGQHIFYKQDVKL
jgi:spore germination cell wall hydrolase CwlJ-like protein